MSKWFDKKFYEHLWAIEDKYGAHWVDVVPESDSDYKYCRNVVDNNEQKNTDEKYEMLLDDIWWVLSCRKVKTLKRLAKEVGLKYCELVDRLSAEDNEEIKRRIRLLKSYVLVDGSDRICYLCVKKEKMYPHIKLNWGEASRLINSDVDIRGYRMYNYNTWANRMKYREDISLTEDEERELLSAKIVKLSA